VCLILVAWQTHADLPLVVAANRDEFHARPTAAADFWHDAPHILAGRDLEAGGTWMGITRTGRFAALTNFRDPACHKPDAPSRGRLVSDFLAGEASIDAYLDELAPDGYNGFNLLLGDGEQLVAFSNVSNERHVLSPGIYGLSNHQIDTPWPKVSAGKTALAAHAIKNRIVIQVNEQDVKKWNGILANIRNIQAELGPKNVAVAVVAIGDGLGMLTAESLAANGVEDALAAGVEFVACGNSMKAQHIVKDDLVAGVSVSIAGYVELMKRQQQSWAYLRP